MIRQGEISRNVIRLITFALKGNMGTPWVPEFQRATPIPFHLWIDGSFSNKPSNCFNQSDANLLGIQKVGRQDHESLDISLLFCREVPSTDTKRATHTRNISFSLGKTFASHADRRAFVWPTRTYVSRERHEEQEQEHLREEHASYRRRKEMERDWRREKSAAKTCSGCYARRSICLVGLTLCILILFYLLMRLIW